MADRVSFEDMDVDERHSYGVVGQLQPAACPRMAVLVLTHPCYYGLLNFREQHLGLYMQHEV